MSADLSVPKAMGGPGKPGTATPEHPCPPAMRPVSVARSTPAQQHHKDASKASIPARVDRAARGGSPIAVKLHVVDPSLPQAGWPHWPREAHEKDHPYSHATRGNVDVQKQVKGRLSRAGVKRGRRERTVSQRTKQRRGGSRRPPAGANAQSMSRKSGNRFSEKTVDDKNLDAHDSRPWEVRLGRTR